MGFKPIANQQYFLVAKNSGMPLGVRDPIESRGAFIEQQNFEPEFVQERPNPRRKRQYFKLEGADFRQFRIKPGGNDLYLDEQNSGSPSSHEDGALLIQYTHLGGAANQFFQLISAGNGYYRVRSLHAPTKFLDVLGNTKAAGANLALVRYTGTENQLFALLPATPAGVAPDPRPLQRVNEDLRNTVLMVAGWVPSVEGVPVGAALKFITGFFWKGTDHEQDFWNQMKSYVDERIATLVQQNELDNMRAQLKARLASIDSTSAAPAHLKGPRIESHILDLEGDQGPYFEKKDGKSPMQIMPHLVGMGTVLLTLLRQRIVNYDELYTKAEDKAKKAETLIYYKAELRRAINRFTRAAVESHIYALEWRRKQISDVTTTRSTSSAHLSSSEKFSSAFTDRFDNWSPQLQVERTHSRGSGNTTTGWPEHKEMLDYYHEQRLAQAEVQFAAEVEVMLNGARLWKYFDADLPAPTTQVRTATVGSFGGRRAGTLIGVPAGVVITPNQDPSLTQGRLTRIVVHTGSHGVVSGLEIAYGGQSTGLMGSQGVRQEEIHLATDEFVTGVYGTFLAGIDSICFETSHGQRATGGRTTGFVWSADLADVLSAALVRVTGTIVGNIVERLSFEWAYAVLGDDLPRLSDIPTAQSLPQVERPAWATEPINLS